MRPRADRGVLPTALVLVCVVLVACSGAPGTDVATAPPTKASPEGDPCQPARSTGGTSSSAREITIWHTYSSVYLDIFHSLVDRFEAAHPDVRIRDEKFDGAEQLEKRLRSKSPEQSPDIVLAPEFSVRRFADSGFFVDAEGCLRGAGVPLAALLPVVRRTWTLDNRLWAVPVNVSAPLLFYNRKLFAAAGIAEPPRDRAALEEASRKLVSAGARSGLVVDDNMALWIGEQWAAQRGVPLFPAGTPPARSAVADDFSWLVAMEREHLVETVGSNPTGYDDLLLLTTPTQPAGMAIHSSAALGLARVLAERGTVQADDVLVAPMPGPKPGALIGGSAAWITARGHEQATAATFVGFLAGPAQQATFNARGGYLPATPAALTEPELTDAWRRYPQLRVAFDQAVATPNTEPFSLAATGPRRELRDVLKTAMASVEAGQDAAAVVDRAGRDIDALLKAYASKDQTPPTEGASR